MTIEKGGVWGEPWPADAPVAEIPEVADDEELARSLADALAEPDLPSEPPTFAPQSGDLLRTIGLEEPRPTEQWHRYPIDLGLAWLSASPEPIQIEADVEADTDVVVAPFVAHLTIRNQRFRGFGPGLSVAVMNAAWLGSLRLGPRAHPNDGLVDITEGTVGVLQRREANRRAATGSHLPHPDLTATRRSRWERSWSRPVTVWLDGRPVGRFRSVAVEVLADAGVVVA